MDALLRLSNGGFSYGRHQVFSGLSLALCAGDVFCLLGPNGCGKTTLLRCLSGLLALDEGRVWLRGQPLSALDEMARARQMGIVFQEHSSPFPYTVLEMVVMGRAPHLSFLATPSQRDVGIAEQALAGVGMTHLRDKPYTQISGGERQLVLIARALAQEPLVLLLDEPTSHLDYGHQMLILATIERLARTQGLAVIMATHFPDHALLIANKAALMKEGGFIAVGPPDHVLTEDNLQQLYGVRVKVLPVEGDGMTWARKAVVPLLGARSEE
ncbi:MAG TPA: ABC transporter ATP-binding protein [Anaerolineae bacterium]|nr:ABC transporter ATP-binding protein [Anaerolineae bacterium]HOQ99684.1 ABC transporter ATP-binding protein [Anaerolineae bacterium]HPL30368.1 ABC transporter ATP-binding protein [Anaerolineae bacterium]